MAARTTRAITIHPAELGLSGLALSAERTSNTVEADGFNQATISVNLSGWAAATTVSVAMDTSPDGTTWYPVQSESTAAGIATLSDLIWRKSVSAADTWVIYTPIANQKIRLRITSASGGASDIASVTLRLENQ